MKLRCLLLALALALALSGTSAWGHDSDTPFADWMKTLMQPDLPLSSCCGPADQFFVREYWLSQRAGVAFEAIVQGRDGQPDFQIDRPRQPDNPTGCGVIFISESAWGRAVLCFVPGAGL